MSSDDGKVEIDYTDLFIQMAVDPAAPWGRYQKFIEKGVVDAGDGKVLLASREAVETACRNPRVFAIDEAGLFMGNVRSFKPQGIDPPLQTKFRRILDPLFSPKRMDLLEDDVAARVNRFIDSFIDRGECNFTEEFVVPFPSSVFLGLMGLPYEDLALLLRFKDDILRPGITRGELLEDAQERLQFQLNAGQEIYAYYEALLDERQQSPQDDILTHLLHAEIDGDRLTREDILDVCFHFLLAGLDTVTDNLTCFFTFLVQHPANRRQLVRESFDHSLGRRGASALGICCSGREAEGQGGHRAPGMSHQSGHRREPRLGSLQLRPCAVPGSARSAIRSPTQSSFCIWGWRAPLPRVAPCPSGAAGDPTRMAPPHS